MINYENKYFQRLREVDDDLDKYRKKIKEQCQKCKGTGSIPIKLKFNLENICESNEKVCGCVRKYNFVKKLILADVPKEFWRVEKWNIRNNRDKWKKYIVPYSKKLSFMIMKGIGLFLYGKNGLGKTTSIMYILMKAIRKGFNVQFLSLKDLLYLIRRICLSKNLEEVESLNELLDEYKSVDILALDEIDKLNITNFVKNEFDAFLRYRISKKLPILMTTNFTERDLIDFYGYSLHDLVSGNMKMIKYEGDSHRKEKQFLYDDIFERLSKRKSKKQK